MLQPPSSSPAGHGQIFAAVITTVECSHIQANGFRNGFQALVREGTDIFAEGIGKEMRMHLPELVLVTGAISCQRSIAGSVLAGVPLSRAMLSLTKLPIER